MLCTIFIGLLCFRRQHARFTDNDFITNQNASIPYQTCFFACYALHIRSVFVTTTKNISPNSIIFYPDAAKENCTPDLQQVKLLDKITIPCRPDNFFSAKQGIFTVKYLKKYDLYSNNTVRFIHPHGMQQV